MRVRVRKWGNSLALRIPKRFAEKIALREGTVMDISVFQRAIVAAPVRWTKLTLKRLLTKVSDRNLHAEVEAEPWVGRESW